MDVLSHFQVQQEPAKDDLSEWYDLTMDVNFDMKVVTNCRATAGYHITRSITTTHIVCFRSVMVTTQVEQFGLRRKRLSSA